MVMRIILGALLGMICYLLGAVIHRRYDAVVRAREDYDEDVDGKQTKEQKEAFLKRKNEEAELLKMSVSKFAGFALKERMTRTVLFILFGAGLGALSFGFFGLNMAGVIYFLFYLILTIIAFTDLDTMEIPPSLNIAIFVLGVISVFTVPGLSLLSRGIGIVCIAVPMMLLDLVVPGAFGGGDIKLLLAAGALLGWKANLIAFFAGAIVAAIISVTLIATKKKGRKEHIPFGPSLCVGYIIASLCGNQLIDWYLGMAKTIIESDL